MAAVRVVVPAVWVEGLLAQLLGLYSVKAEAVFLAANEYLRDRRSLGVLLEHREELGVVDGLVGQLGWQFGLRVDGCELTGPPGLLVELVEGGVLSALEALADSISREPGAGGRAATLLERIEAARSLVGLLGEVERAGAGTGDQESGAGGGV